MEFLTETETKLLYAKADRRAAFWSGFLTAVVIMGSILTLFFASGE